MMDGFSTLGFAAKLIYLVVIERLSVSVRNPGWAIRPDCEIIGRLLGREGNTHEKKGWVLGRGAL